MEGGNQPPLEEDLEKAIVYIRHKMKAERIP
jgi:hypothetical protein